MFLILNNLIGEIYSCIRPPTPPPPTQKEEKTTCLNLTMSSCCRIQSKKSRKHVVFTFLIINPLINLNICP